MFIIAAALLALTITPPAKETPPFTVADDLYDQKQAETLGLGTVPGAETATIFRATPEAGYNHAAVLFPFKGKLYAMWQSSTQDEDAEDTRVLYASSADRLEWSAPLVLSVPQERGIMTSGGWWQAGDELVAYLLVWPDDPSTPRGGYTVYRTSVDGEAWSDPAPVLTAGGEPLNGIIEQDLRALPSGRLLTAVHEQPGLLLSPYYTDDPTGLGGWTRGEMENLPHKEDMTREIEPSWFLRADGSIVMVFRDQDSSFQKLAAVSHDDGAHWTTPELTNMLDSRSKQSTGNLPDGTAFQVSNPTGSKKRWPLVITLSDDGFWFDRAFLVRGGDDMPPLRHEGKYKRQGYSYPKSVIWNDHLYIAYGTNKEDIEVTRLPLTALTLP
ncbi:sialidase family protein [Parvularcula sp. LCG005]|uniref:sialidase family protein n=1 Tax=Parvularcula sp. LCG005 TaxID=3078805 RepID=UPI002941E59E|nr:sialidase family protein [Parvularcula sp. LCG005]WOI53839.1 sialidase family protein [Parvularcula sp. LCG005]